MLLIILAALSSTKSIQTSEQIGLLTYTGLWDLNILNKAVGPAHV